MLDKDGLKKIKESDADLKESPVYKLLDNIKLDIAKNSFAALKLTEINDISQKEFVKKLLIGEITGIFDKLK
jgi:hypothetical protein